MGILVLSLILEGKLNFSPLNIMLAVDLSCMAFFMLKYVPSIPNLLSDFIVGCAFVTEGAVVTLVTLAVITRDRK